MSQYLKPNVRRCVVETLERRNLLAFGLRSLIASEFHEPPAPVPEVARQAVVQAAPAATIIASPSAATITTPQAASADSPSVANLSAHSQPMMEASDETPSPDVAIDVSPEMPSDEASSTATEIRQVPSDDSIAESTADIARTFRTLLLASAHPNTRYQLSVSGIQLGTVATDSSGQLSIELTPVTTQQATTPSDDFQYVDTSAQATAEVDMNSVDVVPDDSQPESETNGSIDVTSNQVDRTDDLAEIQSIDIGLEFENSSSSDSFELATQAVDEVHSEAAIGNLWAPSNSTVEDSGASSSDDRERSGNDVDSVFDIEVDHELGGDFD